MSKQFKGVINLDVRDSVPDWEPYLPPAAAPGKPNVLYVVVDDTGIAAWDTFGGLIEMPNLNRVAKLGLKYTNWHTTALCSPPRPCFWTGRTPHRNGTARFTEVANGSPVRNWVPLPEIATAARSLWACRAGT